MATDAAAELSKSEFVCRHCGAVKPFFYDWQRCYECMIEAGRRDVQTIPGVCPACCKQHHRRPINTK